MRDLGQVGSYDRGAICDRESAIGILRSGCDPAITRSCILRSVVPQGCDRTAILREFLPF